MISRTRLCSTLRKFLPAFLIIYFLLLTVLLLKVPTDITPVFGNPHTLLSYSPDVLSGSLIQIQGPKRMGGDRNGSNVASRHTRIFPNISKMSQNVTQNTKVLQEKNQLKFHEPRPISIPMVVSDNSTSRDNNIYGSFQALQNDFFIYSAYFDNRKIDSFIRFLTLAKQTASKVPVRCHFKDEIYDVTRKALRYELCENHNKNFGGYIFSCEVPEFINSPVSYEVSVSYGKSEKQFMIPVKQVRPSADKLEFLDSYIGENIPKIITKIAKPDMREHRNTTLHILRNEKKTSDSPHQAKSPKQETNIRRLSIAVCVPPLFGEIYPHRLIEFIELTLLLGADHIFFYQYDIKEDVRKVLEHYVTKGAVTVTPWSLPSDVTSEKVWYNGQLLAHNDCVYRTMPHFDLVAFNDIDEFIVPHNNETITWSQAFPGLISNRTCGLSFQSAFFDPGLVDVRSPGLLTAKLKGKTKDFSKIRSKVMLVPWRVFEVGIHHISKQNRENWTVRQIRPSTAFLHHYRECDGYDIVCGAIEQDNTVEKRYLQVLKKNYENAVANIGLKLSRSAVKSYRVGGTGNL